MSKQWQRHTKRLSPTSLAAQSKLWKVQIQKEVEMGSTGEPQNAEWIPATALPLSRRLGERAAAAVTPRGRTGELLEATARI